MSYEPNAKLRDVTTLPEAVAMLFSHAGPCIMALLTAGALTARVYVGNFGAWDLVVAAIMIAIWWFQEWAAHIAILHLKPRTIFGFKFDTYFARVHRAHHRAPWDSKLVFVPTRVVIVSFFIVAPLFVWLFWNWETRLTAMTAYFGWALVYEWTHMIVHTRYKPKTAFAKSLWQQHRLHHFKNENYWFGLSVTFVDELFGTSPNHESVPTVAEMRTAEEEI